MKGWRMNGRGEAENEGTRTHAAEATAKEMVAAP